MIDITNNIAGKSRYSAQALLELKTNAMSGEMLKRISIEPGVREHVIARTTQLDQARPSSRGRMSSTAAPASINGYEMPPNDDFYFHGKQPARIPRFARDSPSASLRGRKAKAFLEQHGSPPGHRVTAGGRIVPDGAYPIKSPSHYPAVPTLHPNSIQDGAVDHLHGLLVNVGNHNICQIINGGFVHVGKENGQLLLVVPPTNDTLSMDGIPLSNFPASAQQMLANDLGIGGFNANAIHGPPQYGSATVQNHYYAGVNGYMGHPNMQGQDAYAYVPSPNSYQAESYVPNNQLQYAGASPQYNDMGIAPFSGSNHQYFGGNGHSYAANGHISGGNAQYPAGNVQQPGGNVQITTSSPQYPSSNSQYPGGNVQYSSGNKKYPAGGHQYPVNPVQNYGNKAQHSTNPSQHIVSGRAFSSGVQEGSESDVTIRQTSNGGNAQSSIRARDPLGGMRPNCQAIRLLEKVLRGHEQALADLNRNEVINRNRMSDVQHNEVVRKRVELTEQMNVARRSLQETRHLVFGDNNSRPPPVVQGSKAHASRNSSQARSSSQEQSVIHAPMTSKDQRYFDRSSSASYKHAQAGGFDGHARPTTAQRAGSFEPTAKEFVPTLHQQQQAPKSLSEQRNFGKASKSPEANVLAERRGNAGLNISTSSHGTTASQNRAVSKSEQSPMLTQGINLDGISTSGRRSHAIEIRRPEQVNSGRAKTHDDSVAVSPVSAAHDEHDDNETAFEPTPSLVAEMMNIVTTPEGAFAALSGGDASSQRYDSQEQHGHASSSTSFNTSSSATTGDFFPIDPQSHSVRNWSYSKSNDNTVHLANWLPKEGEEVASPSNVTPVKGTNKFRFSDSDSPVDENDPPYDKHRATVRTAQALHSSPQAVGDMKRTPQGKQSPNNKESAPSTVNTSFATEKSNTSTNGPSTPTKRTPSKTDQYWSGFRTGLHQFVLPDVTDEDYRLGYRDGLLNSGNYDPSMTPTKTVDSSPIRIRKANMPFRPGGASASFVTRSDPTLKTRAPSNASSPLRRSFGSDEVSEGEITIHYQGESLLPRTDEKTHLSASQNSSPFQPMPYVPIPEPISPLVNRQGAFEERLIASIQKMPNAPGSRIFSGGSYAQQRYVSKGQASVAPSPSYAQGHFHQLDGSNDDDDKPVVLEEASANTGAGASPVRADKGKQKAPSSPIKRASSAMRQLTSIGGPKKEKDAISEVGLSSKGKEDKDEDPSNMTAAEKLKWKTKWKRRFEILKEKEEKEIEANRRRNNRM